MKAFRGNGDENGEDDEDDERRDQRSETFTRPKSLKELYAAFGNALDRFHDEPGFRLPMPARYVLDQHGRIQAADVSPDYIVRPEPEDTVVPRLQAAESKATGG